MSFKAIELDEVTLEDRVDSSQKGLGPKAKHRKPNSGFLRMVEIGTCF